MWGPPVGVSGTLRRVAGPAEDRAVGDVERRPACGKRHDVIDGQVAGSMGVALVTRAPVPALTAPCTKHSRTQALPSPGAVQGVVAAPVRLPGVFGAATAGSARDDTADRAELHSSYQWTAAPGLTLVTLECTPVDIAMSVNGEGDAVYSPRVLRLGDQALGSLHAPLPLGARDLQRARSNSWSSPTSALCVCSPAALAMMPTAMSREGWIAARHRKVSALPACTLVVAPSNVWTPQPQA